MRPAYGRGTLQRLAAWQIGTRISASFLSTRTSQTRHQAQHPVAGSTVGYTATARRFETSGLTRSIEGIGRRNAVELDAGVSAARWDFA
jgi:hypothetical protein